MEALLYIDFEYQHGEFMVFLASDQAGTLLCFENQHLQEISNDNNILEVP